jgi:hypothetical protein
MPPEQNERHTHQPGELKRIHTYESDAEELMRNTSVSKTDIALAESEKRRRDATTQTAIQGEPAEHQSRLLRISSDLPETTRWNTRLILLIGVGALLLSGVGAGTFFILKDKTPARPREAPTVVPKSAEVALTGTESRAGAIKVVRTALDAISVPQNQLRITPLLRAGAAITTDRLFNMLEASAPPALTRTLGALPVLGVHGFKGGQPFLLFAVSSYDYAFDGMLAWEKTLLDDMGPLFGVLPREILGGRDATVEARENVIVFKDIIVRNKDARAAFAPDGRVVFLYSFLDKQTLIFATNEDTLKFLIGAAAGGRLR